MQGTAREGANPFENHAGVGQVGVGDDALIDPLPGRVDQGWIRPAARPAGAADALS